MSTTISSAPSARERMRAGAQNGSPALLSFIALAVIFAVTASLQPGILTFPASPSCSCRRCRSCLQPRPR